jgi:hypothetical protein
MREDLIMMQDFTEQQKPSEDTVKALSVSFSSMDDIEI